MHVEGIQLADLSSGLARWLVTASVQVALVGVGVAVVDRLFAGRVWPQIRAAYWWLLVVMLAAPPILHSPVSILRLGDPLSSVDEYLRTVEPNTSSPPVYFLRYLYADQDATEQRSAPVGVGGALLAIWFAGLAIFSAAAAWRGAQTRRLWFTAPPETPPAWFSTLACRVAARLNMKAPPRIVIHPGDVGPGVVGVWRPVVVMPARLLREGTREQIEHVLLHEFSHVRRHDVLASRACQFVQLIYWFHPVVWLARTRLETLREICCDQAVAHALRDGAPAYRHTLLHMARSLLAQPAQVGFIHTHSQIMARLMHLQRPLPRRPRAVRTTTIVLFAVLAACCVPRAIVTTRPAGTAPINISELPGCMQIRFAVMQAMTDQENALSNP